MTFFLEIKLATIGDDLLFGDRPCHDCKIHFGKSTSPRSALGTTANAMWPPEAHEFDIPALNQILFLSQSISNGFN